jgi:hypothetical protein
VIERNGDGGCIPDATVEVVRGQAVGQRTTQVTPCSVWDYGNGFGFTGLAQGVELTIRASAPGYVPAERTVVPQPNAIEIGLSRVQ